MRNVLLKQLSSSMSNLSTEVFNSAEKEVFRLIESNNWHDFVASPSYLVCCLLIQRSAHFASRLTATCNAALHDLVYEEEEDEKSRVSHAGREMGSVIGAEEEEECGTPVRRHTGAGHEEMGETGNVSMSPTDVAPPKDAMTADDGAVPGSLVQEVTAISEVNEDHSIGED